jgi:hypothetical protein
MNYNFFNIDWVDNHKNLEYHSEYFKDQDLLNNWCKGGIKKTQTKIYLHQIDQPYSWMNNIVTQVNNVFNLADCSYAFHKITPGNFLPMHSDRFDFFKERFSVVDINNIRRIIIFLDKGHDGHLLIVNNQCYINWKKGDYVCWSGSDPHLAANLGTHDRYTLQITGVVNH